MYKKVSMYPRTESTNDHDGCYTYIINSPHNTPPTSPQSSFLFIEILVDELRHHISHLPLPANAEFNHVLAKKHRKWILLLFWPGFSFQKVAFTVMSLARSITLLYPQMTTKTVGNSHCCEYHNLIRLNKKNEQNSTILHVEFWILN